MGKIASSIAVCAFILCLTSAAHAVGIGLYGSSGLGTSTWDNKDINGRVSTNLTYGGGFEVATHVSDYCGEIYRFQAGYDMYRPDSAMIGGSLHRVSIINTWGYAFYDSNNVKIWAGIPWGVRYLFGQMKVLRTYDIQKELPALILLGTSPLRNLVYYRDSIFPRKVNQNLIGTDLGLELGFFFNLGDVVTLSLDLGIRYGVHFLQTDNLMWGYEGYMNLGLLFRVDE